MDKAMEPLGYWCFGYITLLPHELRPSHDILFIQSADFALGSASQLLPNNGKSKIEPQSARL